MRVMYDICGRIVAEHNDKIIQRLLECPWSSEQDAKLDRLSEVVAALLKQLPDSNLDALASELGYEIREVNRFKGA